MVVQGMRSASQRGLSSQVTSHPLLLVSAATVAHKLVCCPPLRRVWKHKGAALRLAQLSSKLRAGLPEH
jgi:hypothetical protein